MRITKKNSIQVSGNHDDNQCTSTPTAIFTSWGSNDDYEVVRLANGRLSQVGGLPDSPKLDGYEMTPGYGNSAAGSRYIYTRVGNAIYRAGATGNFTKFFDGGDSLKLLYRGLTKRTNNRGEFAAAAEDNNGDHWIIELKPNGDVKNRTKAAGKIEPSAGLFYVDF